MVAKAKLHNKHMEWNMDTVTGHLIKLDITIKRHFIKAAKSLSFSGLQIIAFYQVDTKTFS